MPVVTLTSDFGLKDYYVAIIKGSLLSSYPNLTLVDITHNIENHDIVLAAFFLKNTYYHFPKGSIHIVSVYDFPVSGSPVYIAAQYKGHYFIGPDNGIFSMVFEEKPEAICKLESEEKGTFPMGAIFARAAGHIARELPFAELGPSLETIEERYSLQPVITSSQIKGVVIHIDKYENVILNIKRKMFEQIRNDRHFKLYYKRTNPITELSTHYQDVSQGNILCLFNAANHLEISINSGKAGSMLGLKVGDGVQIDFFD